MENRLLDLMIAHHALIETLFTVFRDSLGKSEEVEKNLANFKQQAEKHFFIEESVNFRFVFSSQRELYEIVKELIKEHVEMLDIIRAIEKRLPTGGEVETNKLQDILRHHRQVEEEVLYPEMERTLSQYQKDTIIEEINKVSLESQ
jgi:iron-sulfur cluster repair protein YtfE (RIC family)